MTTIVYHRDLCRVTVDGHAQSGEAGRDLVCASVSILVCPRATAATSFNGEDKDEFTNA